MKAVAYNIKIFEKEYLAKANHKKHDITLISNPLSLETIFYAEGKEAVIASADDIVTSEIIHRLAVLGIKYLIARSNVAGLEDQLAADLQGLILIIVPFSYSGSMGSMHHLADQTIISLDALAT